MIARTASLATAGFFDAFALLAVQDIPGWTELSTLARASVIGFLLVVLAVVVVFLLRALREQQRDHQAAIAAAQAAFITEVQTSRRDYGEVVKTVRSTDDARYSLIHEDVRATIQSVEKICDKVSGLAIQCAQAQATAASLHRAEREEDQSLHLTEREEDQASA